LPVAVIVVGREGRIELVNAAAEQLLDASAGHLTRRKLADLVAEDNPLIALVGQVRDRGASVAEYGLNLTSPRIGTRQVDVQVAPITDERDHILISLQERSMAGKIDHQLIHRRAARSVAGMAAVLAHEIKNPLSGIRGAAQLLEQSASDQDRELTTLICSETDRIRNLVDRMEVFSDDRPLQREQVNIHDVLGHVRKLAVSGFARRVRFKEQYDPSLPAVFGNRDQLVQVFLNLVKNAAEAAPEKGGEIVLSTSFRHGVWIAVPGSRDRLQLPIVVTVQDNGPGIPEDLRGLLFEPFVTTKASGTGLGLSLVAKIIEDHGGVVEIDGQPRRTAVSVLLPVHPKIDDKDREKAP
jgi:two-component system nitrogen regulation sensor histidine kinase GlnL